MHLDVFIQFCDALPHAESSFPFGPDTMVYKVKNKIFALCSIEEFKSINLKCEPAYAEELRERYEAVQPGYHMNKKHWNTVSCDGSLPDKLMKELIVHSYKLVVLSLQAKDRFDTSNL
jgi:predicted DNA-binding protein (MmcQ/YjbR family)